MYSSCIHEDRVNRKKRYGHGNDTHFPNQKNVWLLFGIRCLKRCTLLLSEQTLALTDRRELECASGRIGRNRAQRLDFISKKPNPCRVHTRSESPTALGSQCVDHTVV